MSALMQYIEQILQWMLGFVDWILIEVFSVVGAAAVAVVGAIPVPSFFGA